MRVMDRVEDVPKAHLGFRPGLEGLRGLAVILVVCFHAGWLQGGFLGVDLFLVLSGFLITTLLLEEWQRQGTISLRDFFIRRGLRLYPALLLYLGAFLGAAVLLRYSDVGAQVRSIAWSAVYLADVPLAFGAASGFATEVTHLWTLAAEAQFYLIWPPILVVLLRRRVGLRSIALGAVLVALGVVLVRGALAAGGAPWERLYYGPDMRLDTILIGCIVSVWFVRGAPTFRLPSWLPPLSLAAILAAAFAIPGTSAPVLFAGGLFIVALCAAILVVGATTGATPWLSRLLASRVLRELGAVSYSWYLWHVLFIAFVNFTIGPDVLWAKIGAVGASFIVAELSYRLVEVRFLKMKRRFAHVVELQPAMGINSPVPTK